MIRSKQNTSHLLMIRPAHFGFNDETAATNTFQTLDNQYNPDKVQEKALLEFDAFVTTLRNEQVEIIVVEDTNLPIKPDAIFPNNWITFHQDGSIITYPMFAKKRRLERREEIIKILKENYVLKNRYSFEHYEEKGLILEGTGSMVLDRVNKIVYACLSPRTNIKLLDKFCVLKGYSLQHFIAKFDHVDIYHTNVMMAMAKDFVVICLATIHDITEKEMLLHTFERTGKEVIDISLDQMVSYAGNMLEIENVLGQKLMVMSSQSFNSLNFSQIEALEKHARIIHSPIPTIEKYGGGSARCMIAEVFLPLLDLKG